MASPPPIGGFLRLDEPHVAAGRAALFFLISGALALLGVLVALATQLDPTGYFVVAATDVAIALAVRLLPWARWPRGALAAVVVLAMAVIGLSHVLVDTPLHVYTAFFLLLFIWVGLSMPPRASIWLAPVTAAAYIIPIELNADGGSAFQTALTVVPLCVFVGEVLAHVLWRLRQSQTELEHEVAERTAELRAANAELAAKLSAQASAERALLAAEAKYRTLVEQIPAIVYTATLGPGTRPTYVNPQIEGILGVAPEEWLSDSLLWLSHIHPEDQALLMRRLQIARDSGMAQISEVRAFTRDGRAIWLSDIARVVYDDAGHALFLQGITLDITDRKQAEAALLAERALLEQRVAERTADLRAANVELERASRLKDEFLASMSHELRTPLNAVLGFSEALREEVYGPLAPQQERAIGLIEESGRHLLELISDILDLAKIGAGRIELVSDPIDVESLCRTSQYMVQQAAQKKQISAVVSRDPQAHLLHADPRRLKQVLVNLLSNAVKFTPAGGAVGLDVTCDPDEEVIRFSVWDTGIGIAEEQQPLLFQPFVQLDSRLARMYEGTGLGLALVARLVALHNGSVAVESRAGAGSRFTVSLPWQPPHSPGADTAPTLVAAPGLQRKALLAEDNEQSIQSLCRFLAEQGYQVAVAREGEQALALARAVRPALVLMDVQMPGLSGLDVMRRLRAIEELAATPIIALTALEIAGDRERCLAAGATVYLPKPVSRRALAAAVTMAISTSATALHADAN